MDGCEAAGIWRRSHLLEFEEALRVSLSCTCPLFPKEPPPPSDSGIGCAAVPNGDVAAEVAGACRSPLAPWHQVNHVVSRRYH